MWAADCSDLHEYASTRSRSCAACTAEYAMVCSKRCYLFEEVLMRLQARQMRFCSQSEGGNKFGPCSARVRPRAAGYVILASRPASERQGGGQLSCSITILDHLAWPHHSCHTVPAQSTLCPRLVETGWILFTRVKIFKGDLLTL